MKLYFAPLEGITGYVYRNAHKKYYGGIDKYFTPFLSPTKNKAFTARERNDVLPEHNQGICVVPQILTSQAEYFRDTEKELRNYGYQEINLNLGCPSPTVVTKKKGAGLLSDPEYLDAFLYEIFAHTESAISVKTRIGAESPEEFAHLLEIFEKYPIKELIIHPRTRTEMYRGSIHEESFEKAYQGSFLSLCYNGDICTAERAAQIGQKYEGLPAIMIGRGLLKTPVLSEQIAGISKEEDRERFLAFHEEILCGYEKIMSGDRNTLFKMKELWSYLGMGFGLSPKEMKKIHKAGTVRDYRMVLREILEK